MKKPKKIYRVFERFDNKKNKWDGIWSAVNPQPTQTALKRVVKERQDKLNG